MTQTATTTTATYRKTKAGEWVAYAPASLLTESLGTYVQVAKKDGSIREEIVARVGRAFAVSGVEMAYGYLSEGRGYTLAAAPGGTPAAAYSDCDNGHTTYHPGCFCCQHQIGL